MNRRSSTYSVYISDDLLEMIERHLHGRSVPKFLKHAAIFYLKKAGEEFPSDNPDDFIPSEDSRQSSKLSNSP